MAVATALDVASLPAARRARLEWRWLAGGVGALAGAVLLGVLLGPASLPWRGVLLDLLDAVPGVHVDSGLSSLQHDILWEIRLPRVVLGAIVGAMLAAGGGAYQGVFRNPLADPYLLGVAAGAGMGATISIAYGPTSVPGPIDPLPLLAFVGALAAVAATYALGATGEGRSRNSSTIVLAGVAVASFFTAVQTYVQQREVEDLRQVWAWTLGGLATSGWSEVRLVLPYVIISVVVLLSQARMLDALRVGEDEATTLGVDARRVRLTVVLVATFGTAAVVAVSGLIGFVGIIVPHGVRLLAGGSYRRVLPLSLLFGAAFLVLTDLLARTLESPAELPIGVVTAFFGAPFFVVVLRTRNRLR